MILVSSEAGSITLRHESEGGGMYGHHASKAALNMVGKLLSFDLKDKGVAVGLVHPAFMRTEMVSDIALSIWATCEPVLILNYNRRRKAWASTSTGMMAAL